MANEDRIIHNLSDLCALCACDGWDILQKQVYEHTGHGCFVERLFATAKPSREDSLERGVILRAIVEGRNAAPSYELVYPFPEEVWWERLADCETLPFTDPFEEDDDEDSLLCIDDDDEPIRGRLWDVGT